MDSASSALVARTLGRVRALFYLALLSVTAGACGNVYTGSASTLKPTELRDEQGWVRVEGVPELHQKHELDCGPTALAMVLGYHGAVSKETLLAELPEAQRSVVTQLRDVAKKHGFESYVMEGKPEDLVYELKHGRPVIVGVAKPTLKDAVAHYEVVVGLHRESQRVATIDPAVGLRQNTFNGFLTEWQGAGRVLLVVIPKGTKPSTSSEPLASAPH
ncbi:MAG TPA: cysteine peptidase family C39 domain-containing protein [Polyangiales bacterium]|nr:cysteine peptidase family C39 domain-containing protein [Polyangiales bacterium]